MLHCTLIVWCNFFCRQISFFWPNERRENTSSFSMFMCLISHTFYSISQSILFLMAAFHFCSFPKKSVVHFQIYLRYSPNSLHTLNNWIAVPVEHWLDCCSLFPQHLQVFYVLLKFSTSVYPNHTVFMWIL